MRIVKLFIVIVVLVSVSFGCGGVFHPKTFFSEEVDVVIGRRQYATLDRKIVSCRVKGNNHILTSKGFSGKIIIPRHYILTENDLWEMISLKKKFSILSEVGISDSFSNHFGWRIKRWCQLGRMLIYFDDDWRTVLDVNLIDDPFKCFILGYRQLHVNKRSSGFVMVELPSKQLDDKLIRFLLGLQREWG